MGGLNEIWNILKQVKHNKPKPKFCPKCKSHNIFPTSTFGILPPSYRCRDCGYEGSLVFEIEPDEEH